MAYDEETHFGLIKLFSGRLLPVWPTTPEGAEVFGAISRDPSYMYHYLMSFPYRLLAAFMQSETTQIIALRFTSIALFAAGVVAYRKVLFNMKASRALVHFVLAVFILTPVVPLLAGQINYDNLVFLVTALCLLLAQQLTRKLKQDKHIDFVRLMLLLALCLFGALVKYAFLPVFLAILLYYVVVFVRHMRGLGAHTDWLILRNSLKKYSKLQLGLLCCLLLLVTVLAAERYGLNALRYGTPIPECNQVLSVERCQAYGPWARNYRTHQDKLQGRLPPASSNPISFTTHWVKRLANELFFTLSGSTNGYKVGRPVAAMRYMVYAITFVGVILFLRWQRELRRRFDLALPLLLVALYAATLWLQNYSDFIHLGVPFAIQGRYLLPILPLVYLLLGLGYRRLFQRRVYFKPILVTMVLAVLCTQGGGIGLYILSSDKTWYWPNQTVIQANEKARNGLKPFITGTIGR